MVSSDDDPTNYQAVIKQGFPTGHFRVVTRYDTDGSRFENEYRRIPTKDSGPNQVTVPIAERVLNIYSTRVWTAQQNTALYRALAHDKMHSRRASE